ncbi:MAG TPA: tetratricopeptide repeat protein, partial [Candidatus Acidoferrum sp.]|nr:tetratricopeptide repeat protein [Candidatus Acidoferrum sp.]
MEQKAPRSFVRSYLPWLIAAGMLVLYLVTLNKHVTLSSVLPVARGSGLDWRPVFVAPLTWLMTLPVRWLPSGAQLIGLNLIGALCATVTLALLARSVALLPHDRTHDQRLREKSEGGLLSTPTSWIPPVFAALLLGLQRTFWENAIVCTGEIIDTLVIAYVIRCLLEFRVDQRDSWLYKLAFVYGIGITNNFALIVFAPAMLVAVVWVKALRFFQFSFLMRIVAFGLAGLCLYLLLPIVQSFNDLAPTSFFSALRINLGFQKQYITGVHRLYALWIGGVPLMLLLVASIKWSSGFGDSSRLGSIAGTAMAHVLHVGLLALTIWMALDLTMSPRFLAAKEPQLYGLSFLSSYYLMALAAGYFVGYLLLVFSDYAAGSRRPAPGMAALSYLVTALVCTAAIAAPVRLAMQNWPRIQALNAKEFRDYARNQLASLPTHPTTVLSDDPLRLFALSLAGGAKAGHMLIEGSSLSEPAYLKFLQKKYPDSLPPLPPEATNSPMPLNVVLNLLSTLNQKQGVYYLHPSFGQYFETYYLEPQQLVYRLERYPTNAIEAPLPTPAVIAQQADFWNKLATTTLRPLETRRTKLTPDERLMLIDFHAAARHYAQALDYWGVELQRAGRFDDAFKFFESALAVNPDNAAAFINREANVKWRREQKRIERISDEGIAKLQLEPGGIEGLLNNSGPIDESSFRFEIAQFFSRNGLWRQAAQQALRAISYAPDDAVLQNGLAKIYLHSAQPDRALNVIKTIRASRSPATADPAMVVETIRAEAAAYFSKEDFAAAEKILKDAVTRYPEQNGSFEGLASFYSSRAEVLRQSGKQAEANVALTNALRISEQQVQQQPNNPAAYFNLGNSCIQLKLYSRAGEAFGRVLEFEPKNFAAALNRAISYFQGGKLDEAQQAYEKVLDATRTEFRVYYGLAEIAYQKKDWKAARGYYENYLKY